MNQTRMTQHQQCVLKDQQLTRRNLFFRKKTVLATHVGYKKGIVLKEIKSFLYPSRQYDGCLFYCHSKISVVQSNRPYDLKNFVMLQGHRYLDPPILGVQRRRVKLQHPDSPPPHTSNSVQNCASSPTTTLQ